MKALLDECVQLMVARCPLLFFGEGPCPSPRTLAARGAGESPPLAEPPCKIEVEEGWFAIVYGLCRRLETILEGLPPGARYRAEVIKEKFGALRVYLTAPRHRDEGAIRETLLAVQTAQEEAARTCQRTGRPGSLYVKEGWYRVLYSGVAQAEGWAPVPPSQDPRGGPFNLIFCEGNDMGNRQ